MKTAHDEGVDRAHRRCFGRREDAGVDAAHDDDDQQQAPDRRAEGLPALAPGRLGLTRVVELLGAIPGDAAEHRRQRQAGNHAGHEQRADRGVGRHRVHHHDDGRRNQDAERAGGGDDAGPELVRETRLDHRRQQDRADRHHRRRAGTGDRREQRTGQHAGQTEAAVPVADHAGGEVDHPFRHPAVGQEVAGEDEERDRHDLELLDAGEQLERHRFERHLGHGEQEGQHRQAERNRDRHAGQHEDGQQAENDQGVHGWSPLSSLRRSPCGARICVASASRRRSSPLRRSPTMGA